jgi:hypothetical protein
LLGSMSAALLKIATAVATSPSVLCNSPSCFTTEKSS